MSDLLFLLLFLGGIALLRLVVEGLDRLVGPESDDLAADAAPR